MRSSGQSGTPASTPSREDGRHPSHATPLICVVAAAGRSRRFGAADKRHARLEDGRRLLAASLAAAAELTGLLRRRHLLPRRRLANIAVGY